MRQSITRCRYFLRRIPMKRATSLSSVLIGISCHPILQAMRNNCITRPRPRTGQGTVDSFANYFWWKAGCALLGGRIVQNFAKASANGVSRKRAVTPDAEASLRSLARRNHLRIMHWDSGSAAPKKRSFSFLTIVFRIFL